MNTLDLSQHTKDDLSLMIDVITTQIKEVQCLICEHERTIDNAEDMSEVVEKIIRDNIAKKRKQVEDLYAWRILFLNAWSSTSNKIIHQ